MKRAFIPIIILLSLIVFPVISAEIVINQQPENIYNLGDTVSVPITIKAISGITSIFNMDLLCGNRQINFYKNGVSLLAGEEKTMDASLVLTKELIGEYTGTCKIKAILPGEYKLTDEFKISNVLTIQPNTEQNEFEPGQSILIFGGAIKENGHEVNGLIDMEIVIDNSSNSIVQPGTINNGMYSMNVTFPEKMKAGNYLVKLNAYELTSEGSKTNKGFVNYNIKIKQIPTSLELHFENESVEPGTNVKVMAILHDQTGERMSSSAIITIKKGETEIKLQSEKQTEEYLEYPILYNEPPAKWTVFAMSNQLSAKSQFNIIEKTSIKVEVANETVFITNVGNIPYNNSVIVKIGNDSQIIPVFLAVGELKKYGLKAPNGEYEVEVLSDGESKLKQNVVLTGRAIGIKDLSQANVKDFFFGPFGLIILGLILLLVIFILLRRRHKRYPYGISSPPSKKKVKQAPMNIPWENREVPVSKNSKLETRNKANLSISIKGNKQEVCIVNIKTKNLGELQSKKTNIDEQLQKIISIAENKKAFVYENQDNLFFILTPSKTRTLKNENAALEIAQDAKEILSSYNRIAKNKIDFGIGLECGSIVEKIENGMLEFMTLGNLMTQIKRISSNSQGEIFFGEEIRKRLTNVRTEKQDNTKGSFYKMKDIKYHESGHSLYMDSFLKKANEKGEINKNNNSKLSEEDAKDPKSLIKGFY